MINILSVKRPFAFLHFLPPPCANTKVVICAIHAESQKGESAVFLCFSNLNCWMTISAHSRKSNIWLSNLALLDFYSGIQSKYKMETELCGLRAIYKNDLCKYGCLPGKCFLPTIIRQWRTIFRRFACHCSVLYTNSIKVYSLQNKK